MKLDKFSGREFCHDIEAFDCHYKNCNDCLSEAAHKFYQEQVDKAMAEKVALIDWANQIIYSSQLNCSSSNKITCCHNCEHQCTYHKWREKAKVILCSEKQGE